MTIPLPPAVSKRDYEYALRGARIQAARLHRYKASEVPLEDCVVIAECAVYRAALAFDPKGGSKFSSYAWGGVKLRVVNARRQWSYCTSNRLEALMGGAEPIPADLPPLGWDARTDRRMSSDDVEGEALRRVQDARLAAVIASLPERDQAIIRLHFWDDLSFREIGERIGTSKETPRKRMLELLPLLRTMLEGRLDG